MDMKTGEIISVEEVKKRIGEKGLKPGKFAVIEKLPDAKCTNCKGRGFIGVSVVTGYVIPCVCVGKITPMKLTTFQRLLKKEKE